MHALQHFKTITKHRHAVIRNCKKAGILWQGLFHDLSKYTFTEFSKGAKFYKGDKSPNTGEREEYGYSAAWLHHKGRNKHHFEYWMDYNTETGKYQSVKMPLKYVKEMFCDRVAASRIYQGKNYNEAYPLEYFLKGKPNRIIHPETSELLEKMLTILKDAGEKEAFKFVRELKEY